MLKFTWVHSQFKIQLISYKRYLGGGVKLFHAVDVHLDTADDEKAFNDGVDQKEG